MTPTTSTEPADLPDPISRYLAAHRARDRDTAIGAFAPGAVVVDEGNTYRGTTEILGFLENAGSEFTYTTTLVSVDRTAAGGWVVRNRLEGDFPGGVADLAYRFTVTGDGITELVIAP